MQINTRVTKQAWQNQLRQFHSFEETERETQMNEKPKLMDIFRLAYYPADELL